jgi:hypothetical protein
MKFDQNLSSSSEDVDFKEIVDIKEVWSIKKAHP